MNCDLTSQQRPVSINALLEDPFYESRIAKEAYDFLTPYFGDFIVDWIGNNVDISLHKRWIGGIGFFGIASGAGVEINYLNVKQRNFMSLITPIQSLIGVVIDGKSFKLPTLNTIMLSAQNQLTLNWGPSTQELAVQVPYDILYTLANELYQDRPLTAAEFNQCILLNGYRLACFHTLLSQALFVKNRSFTQPFQDAWIQQTERSFALLTLEMLLSPTPSLENDHYKKSKRKPTLKVLERLEAYMHAQLEAPLTINDLVTAASCSRSQLFNLCQQQLGLSPMAWLRKMRLESARDSLISNPALSITEVAYRFGFGHTGRFAKYYQCQFGELPHQTRL